MPSGNSKRLRVLIGPKGDWESKDTKIRRGREGDRETERDTKRIRKRETGWGWGEPCGREPKQALEEREREH